MKSCFSLAVSLSFLLLLSLAHTATCIRLYADTVSSEGRTIETDVLVNVSSNQPPSSDIIDRSSFFPWIFARLDSSRFKVNTGSWMHLFRRPDSKLETTFNVRDYGAVGDGSIDDTEAFKSTWTAACKAGSTMEVSAGSTYLVDAITFQGPCSSGLILQVDGNVVAPPKSRSHMMLDWILFDQVSVSVQGVGSFDGNGGSWWSEVESGNKPTLMRFRQSNSISVHGISLKNSPQIQLKFDTCNGVNVQDVKITAPGSSPNTDGISVSKTQNVELGPSTIATGDDCISIQSGSAHLNIHDIQCGPGHGISIGGLGKDHSFASVSDVRVNTVTFQNTQNGIRIKTWQGGDGTVSGVSFENIHLDNTANPVIIDQYYCNGTHNCGNSSRAVQVKDITYSNISGTSADKVALKFQCSDSVACTNIQLSAIDISYGSSSAESVCWNAFGSHSIESIMIPASCLH